MITTWIEWLPTVRPPTAGCYRISRGCSSPHALATVADVAAKWRCSDEIR